MPCVHSRPRRCFPASRAACLSWSGVTSCAAAWWSAPPSREVAAPLLDSPAERVRGVWSEFEGCGEPHREYPHSFAVHSHTPSCGPVWNTASPPTSSPSSRTLLMSATLPQFGYFERKWRLPGTDVTITGHSKAMERTGFLLEPLCVVLGEFEATHCLDLGECGQWFCRCWLAATCCYPLACSGADKCQVRVTSSVSNMARPAPTHSCLLLLLAAAAAAHAALVRLLAAAARACSLLLLAEVR